MMTRSAPKREARDAEQAEERRFGEADAGRAGGGDLGTAGDGALDDAGVEMRVVGGGGGSEFEGAIVLGDAGGRRVQRKIRNIKGAGGGDQDGPGVCNIAGAAMLIAD